MNKILLSFFLSLFFCLNLFGQQQERIIRFQSDIVIDTTGKIVVAEHIKVYVAGKDIQRGIVRELPLYRKNKEGKRVRVEINLLSVQCNGVESKYHTEYEGDNFVIYTGASDVFLSTGEYDYVFVYESSGHIGFFEGFDELYWNVTGNGWVFPIEQAKAIIILPAHAVAIKTFGYTGKYEETGADYSVEESGDIVQFATTRTLMPYEGLTVAVAFPRDLIKRPLPQTFWSANKIWISISFFLLTIILFFVIMKQKVKNSSPKQEIIPLFHPPQDWSPAKLKYMTKKYCDNKAFTADLINMAIKGALSIKYVEKIEKKGLLAIKYTQKSYFLENKMNTSKLTPEELQLHSELFSQSQSVELSEANQSLFLTLKDLHRKSMDKACNLNDYYRRKRETFWMQAPTEQGAKIIAETEGLKMYIKNAEEDTLGTDTQEKTSELFEKLLPYAIAFGVSNPWCKKFKETLSQLNYQPDWYAGNEEFADAGFIASFIKSFSYSVFSSTTSDSGSWSSGSGGGGSSGGGGGGGGGRGW
jgi:uncharacterized membrane protein YgcG